MLEYTDDEQFTLEEFCRDLFDEPFTSVEDTIVAMTPAVDTPRIASDSVTSSKEVAAVKTWSKRSYVGTKVRSKLFRQRNKGIDNNQAINSAVYKKDLSDGKYKFYAFPTYSSSDALLFLPTALATHFNSADVPSLSRLLLSHLDKDCAVKLRLLRDEAITIRRFIQFNHLMMDLHPDLIMCVHNTRVVGSQLHASIYVKFTDCRPVYDSVSKNIRDPRFQKLFGTHRLHNRLHEQAIHDASNEIKNDMSALVNGDEDLNVYARLDLALAINQKSRKVTQFSIHGHVTSMKALTTTIPHE